jgi:single-stranded DNA-binding protein
MSGFRLQFAGEAKKVQLKSIGAKTAMEFSLCSKNYTAPGAEAKWTWIRVTVWEPKDWLIQGVRDGVFVAGSGEFSTRSYDASTGEKKMEAEVRCSGFDLTFARPPQVNAADAETVRLPARSPSTVPDATDEPPF